MPTRITPVPGSPSPSEKNVRAHKYGERGDPNNKDPNDDVVEIIGPLVAKARTGNVRAWSRLYDLFFPRIVRYACILVGDPDMAEDIAQETFARAMVSLPSFRGDARFSTWLHGICLNLTRNQWRRQKNTNTAHDRLESMSELARPNTGDPDAANLQKRRATVLYDVLETLPDTLRAAFMLREISGLSQRETATQLGITESNVAVRANRARNRVRSELERLGWIAPKGAKS